MSKRLSVNVAIAGFLDAGAGTSGESRSLKNIVVAAEAASIQH